MLKLCILNRYKYEADTVKCLVDMGFSRERALYALHIKNNVYSVALEWLIENQSSNSLNIQLSPDASASQIASNSSSEEHKNVSLCFTNCNE